MDTSQQTAVIPRDRELSVALKRQRRSIAEKRRIVEETLVEGASVAWVARAHGDASHSIRTRVNYAVYLAGRLEVLQTFSQKPTETPRKKQKRSVSKRARG